MMLVVCLSRSEEHTSELQSPDHLVCRLLLEKNLQEDDQTPIANAGVQVFPARGYYGDWGWANTDMEGFYHIVNLQEGEYQAIAWAEGFLPEYYQEADSLHKADILSLAENDTLDNIDFTLSLGATISGTVADSSGKPIQSVYVEVLAIF